MPDRKTILILGGTREARKLAERLAETRPDLRVITALAGRLEPVRPIPGEVRVGGFGGADGLAAYLRDTGIGAVLDLTHPFAATISAHARAACEAADVPRLQFQRPPWTPPPGMTWHRFPTLDAIADALPRYGARALLSVGVQGLPAFRAVTGVFLAVRQVEAPAESLALRAEHAVIVGRPPFTLTQERRLFAEHRIDALVTKESGGSATEAKIIAAAEAKIPVLALKRPPAEPGDTADSLERVMVWIDAL